MTNSKVVRNTEQPTVKLVFELAYSHVGWVHSGPDLSITKLCTVGLKTQEGLQQTVVRIESVAGTVYILRLTVDLNGRALMERWNALYFWSSTRFRVSWHYCFILLVYL